MIRLDALAAASALMVAGLLGGCGSTAPEPAPLLPFGDFEVGEFGGVAGRQKVLHVRPDGVALLMSSQPAAGRMPPSTMDRLRVVFESEELRREVAVAVAEKRPPRCADLLSTSVTMGALTRSVEEPCGSEKQPATPAYNEILAVTGPALNGELDGPVGDPEPKLVGLTLERRAHGDLAAYRISVTPEGRTTWESAGTVRRRVTLDPSERDVLRLLVGRLVEEPTKRCRTDAYVRLTISGSPASAAPECSYPDRDRELTAVTQLLQQALDVDQ